MDYCIFCLGTVQAAAESTAWSDIAQTVTAVASLAVAGIALNLTRKQAHEMVLLGEATRAHNRISVRPLFDFHVTLKSEHASITIKNCGIGPAIIESVQLKFQGEDIQLEQEKLIELIKNKFTTFPYLAQVEVNGETVLSQNQELNIIDITPGPNANGVPPHEIAASFHNATTFIRNLEIIVNYRCIYGDKYKHHHKIISNTDDRN